MRKLLHALQFLTIVPVKIKGKVKNKDYAESLAFFPLAGAFIGAVPALFAFVFSLLPGLVISAFAITILIILTGALHIDGLADTFDGIFCFKPKDKKLEIMRDSRIGAMGMTAIVCQLILKFAILAGTPSVALCKVLILMPAFGRWAQVMSCYLCPYAREEGRAKDYIDHAGFKEALAATVFMLALVYFLMSLRGIVLFFVSMLPVFLFIRFIRNKIGGMTGDTIGAVSELAETVLIFFNLF